MLFGKPAYPESPQAEKMAEGETNDSREYEEMCSSQLFVHGDVRKILQRAVRNDGKNAGHRVQMRASRLQREDRLEPRI